MRAWLTTVVGRICLDMLRARKTRREELTGGWLPEPLVVEPAAGGPAEQAEMADSVGLALLVVLESLTPAERLAFVLHDVFDMSFGEVGQIIGRTDGAARQLATLTGAGAVAGHIVHNAPQFIGQASLVLVNGAPGLLFGTRDALISVLGFTVTDGRIAELDMVADPAKLRHLAIQP
jgi:Sigma-70, region 4